MRQKGRKVGLVRMSSFVLSQGSMPGCAPERKKIAVIDRNLTPGPGGDLLRGIEIGALFRPKKGPCLRALVMGLGGRMFRPGISRRPWRWPKKWIEAPMNRFLMWAL